MKQSNINIAVTLDDEHVPEKIMWEADDNQQDGMAETKALSLALWDPAQRNSLRIDLWAKDMPLEDMKRFHVDCIGGMAQSILNSTGDEYMASEINSLCEKLVEHLKKDLK